MLNARSSHLVFWNIFLKFSGKHLWCSPNISKLFNRPPENRFNNRQYTTHIEQLSMWVKNALSQFKCLYLLYQNEFFTISGNLQNFWLHRTTFLGKPLMERSWVFSWAPQTDKKPGKLPDFKIYYQTKQNCFVLIWTRNKLSVVSFRDFQEERVPAANRHF